MALGVPAAQRRLLGGGQDILPNMPPLTELKLPQAPFWSWRGAVQLTEVPQHSL
jgi:hypothetical protein